MNPSLPWDRKDINFWIELIAQDRPGVGVGGLDSDCKHVLAVGQWWSPLPQKLH